MNPQIDDQMLLMSQYYPDEIYGHFAPPQDDQVAVVTQKPKARRRRKKAKSEQGEGVMRKRKLSDEQVTMLEESFGNEHKLESERKDKLAKELGLDPRQVAVWFQNRRARWKTKKLEEQYSQLKSEHDSNVSEKCRLEFELQKIKEQLVEAENEIQRLSSDRWDAFSSNSPASSLSMDIIQQEPQFLGDHYGMETGLENVFYVPQEQNYGNNGLGWDSTIYYM